MAAPQQNSTASPPSAQMVGNAFVQQYYHILHQSPDLVHRFYHESSKLGRHDGYGHGEMTSVTTMQAINDKITSIDCLKAEINTVDAQESQNGGVIVLVTGYLTGRDEVRREFTQSFFLATQEKGYFVLNDMFRYVGGGQGEVAVEQQSSLPSQELDLKEDGALENGTVETHVAEETLDAAPPQEQHIPDHAPEEPAEEDEPIEEEVYNPTDDAEHSVIEEEEPAPEVIDEVPNNVAAVVTISSAPVPLEEAPKKTYASIVKVINAAPLVPSHPVRPPPQKQERQVPPAPIQAAAPVADAPAFSSSPESSNIQEPKADGHSIYIRNLPLSASSQQLDDEFKRFGTIKYNGIQVRSNKVQGFCYGFVEFDEASAVQSAIQASPITIGGRQCYIEEKRTSGSRGGNRGRFAPGRNNSFRNEGSRGRGGYGGGRGYGRGEFSYRGDYGGRGGGRGGSSSRGGDAGYQRADQVGPTGGRGNRSGGSDMDGASK